MSLKRDKTVLTLVEKYRREFPELESRYLRRLIRSENKELFSDSNPSQLKQLTRCLKKSYGQPVQGKSEGPAPEVPTKIKQAEDPAAQARAALIYSLFMKSPTTLQLEAEAEREFQNRFKRANQK